MLPVSNLDGFAQPIYISCWIGNVVEVKQKKKLTKREEKALIKKVKAKIDKGEELDSDEE
jgi:hypothetical protein